MINSSVEVVCYKSKKLANGSFPLMLRICKDGKKTYKSLGISMNPTLWNFSKNEPKLNHPNREQLMKIILAKKMEMQNRILDLNAEAKDYTTSTLLNPSNKKIQIKTVGDFLS